MKRVKQFLDQRTRGKREMLAVIKTNHVKLLSLLLHYLKIM